MSILGQASRQFLARKATLLTPSPQCQHDATGGGGLALVDHRSMFAVASFVHSLISNHPWSTNSVKGTFSTHVVHK